MVYTVCPKCGYTQLNSEQCKKCNFLLDKRKIQNSKNEKNTSKAIKREHKLYTKSEVEQISNQPICPDCKGPVSILPPSDSSMKEIPLGWDALFIIIFNPLTGPLYYLIQPWFCPNCKKEIPINTIPKRFRLQRLKIGFSFILIGLILFMIVILLLKNC